MVQFIIQSINWSKYVFVSISMLVDEKWMNYIWIGSYHNVEYNCSKSHWYGEICFWIIIMIDKTIEDVAFFSRPQQVFFRCLISKELFFCPWRFFLVLNDFFSSWVVFLVLNFFQVLGTAFFHTRNDFFFILMFGVVLADVIWVRVAPRSGRSPFHGPFSSWTIILRTAFTWSSTAALCCSYLLLLSAGALFFRPVFIWRRTRVNQDDFCFVKRSQVKRPLFQGLLSVSKNKAFSFILWCDAIWNEEKLETISLSAPCSAS